MNIHNLQIPGARRLAAVLAALLAWLPGMPAAAKTAYPSGPIHMVVPFQAGGLTDILARTIGNRLAAEHGWNVIVENKPGAGGNIGAEYVARSRPDGQTLLMGSIGTNATNPFFYKDMHYDPRTAFAPVAMGATGTLLLVVNPELPVHDLRELIAYAKAHPGTLSYASGGVGTSQYLAGELLKSMAGLKIQHIPYKGISPAMADLLGGRVSMTFDMATVLPYVKQGRLRPIAVANPRRSAALPDIPTIAEAGVPGYSASAWYGVFAPKGTPPQIVGELNAAINHIVAEPKVRAELLSLGAEPSPMSAEEFRNFVAGESAKWAKVLGRAPAKH
ncbi:tripartite tricarboxylate transporter substrate binding protein [Candidimonas humi]|uniref:Bug family tripartite tricarboxylate transporter substrate binding protein n=1 Tax=Candidimonas humi TaxID=683355 RepID=A0ABV8P5A2_9BURK|nr:tripartite tricarboxylate transporter substrate binding protein [Candidimonas humi]MBV6307124.1 tripartite tricarboxylate transporter substrate binding protein [Candidimonas humi]